MNYFTTVNLPVNGIKDMITGVVYPYENGNLASRQSAEASARAAQNSVKISLGLPESAGLAEWKAAYAASQE